MLYMQPNAAKGAQKYIQRTPASKGLGALSCEQQCTQFGQPWFERGEEKSHPC